jgi:hypothetical protein
MNKLKDLCYIQFLLQQRLNKIYTVTAINNITASIKEKVHTSIELKINDD